MKLNVEGKKAASGDSDGATDDAEGDAGAEGIGGSGGFGNGGEDVDDYDEHGSREQRTESKGEDGLVAAHRRFFSGMFGGRGQLQADLQATRGGYANALAMNLL